VVEHSQVVFTLDERSRLNHKLLLPFVRQHRVEPRSSLRTLARPDEKQKS
jgi:hypothetical protein